MSKSQISQRNKRRYKQQFNQRGFSIVTAIFLVVVLASLGTYMLSITGAHHSTPVFAVQGARVYQAARSGIEWAVFRVVNDANCATVTASPAFTTADPGLASITVTLTCSSPSTNVYYLQAISSYGNPADLEYVSRTINTTVFP